MTKATTGRMSFTSDGVVRTNTYLTPKSLLEKVYACLDVVDLDPCSNDSEYPQVHAKCHFTEAENGLAYPWYGTAFVNPPYKSVGEWTWKFIDEYRKGNMTEGIYLVAASQETGWYQSLLYKDVLVCAIRGRLHFDQAVGVPCKEQSRFPSSLFYLGHRGERFIKIFRDVGAILQPVL